MSEDFTNKAVSAALLERIRSARTTEEVRSACVDDGVSRGVYVRDESGSTSVRENLTTQQQAPQVQQDDGTLFRRAVTLPDGRTRLLEAFSISGLDTLEAAFRKNQI